MPESQTLDLPDLSGVSDDAWLSMAEEFGEEHGYFEPLGDDHSAIFLDQSTTLLVTFETLPTLRAANAKSQPLGHVIAAKHGYSQLCLIAHTPGWFRDHRVYGYFDRLVDDGFFEDFDRVVFYGAAACGYAAAAYSVVAPGATVIALQPQATLDPASTGWDTRFIRQRRLNFTDRYGYAPDMLDAAHEAFVLYDPEREFDAMHASLFHNQHIARLKCRFFGAQLEKTLLDMGLLKPMLAAACEGQFTPLWFHKSARARRRYLPYLRQLLRQIDDDGRLQLVRMLCTHVTARVRASSFEKRLSEVTAQIKSQSSRELAD